MAGTAQGGKKVAAKNLAKDPDYYKKLGARGGAAGVGTDYQKGGSKAIGFAANPDLARKAGVKGGRTSRKGKPLSSWQKMKLRLTHG